MGQKGRGWLTVVGEDREKGALMEMEEMVRDWAAPAPVLIRYPGKDMLSSP